MRKSLGIGLTLLITLIVLGVIYGIGSHDAQPIRLWLTLIVLFVLVWRLDRLVLLLRDIPPEAQNATASYSLGRAQMAFWTCLIVSGLIYIIGTKIITCAGKDCLDFEILKLDKSVLILLGISGVTGAAAMLVDVDKDNKKKDAVAEKGQAAADIASIQKLLDAAIADPGQAANVPELQAKLSAAQLAVSQAVTKTDRSSRNAEAKGFFEDIMQDSNGNSLHRLQMILFTLLTGVVFLTQLIGSKATAMPVIPTEMLELLGISNSLYVGFKIPGK